MLSSLSTIVAAVIGFGLTAVMGFWFIPFLKRVHYGQTINDIGPTWHKNKQGTPTMGGIMFIIGVVVAVAVGFGILTAQTGVMTNPSYKVQNTRLIAGLIMALCFGFVGFVDDYIKVVKKRNLGLTARQKLVMQFLIAILYLFTLYLSGDTSTELWFPLIGYLNFGIFYYPLMVLFIVFITNAVNLTDGIDGLASSVTFVAAIGFMLITMIMGFTGMGILATALAGACIGFLVWNFHPAKVFMGDTGSMFLGGMVVALAFGVGLPVILILVGILYIIEALSVIIQVTSFKLTGKRVFKMSPIHHHFEMSGYSEVKIVALFSLITAIGCALAVWAVMSI
ncbi:phospho-N-acetylmuramoyl-pentapeptide-transferase [Zongyangia hominis]|uniref:Phospho-N-acetylmuramoyl-pentapeptide-transferase n=1 Tax=Zongyangia hominis TaxID=2763677 RepID=A0A926IBB2_9FIRM|nr:phospho-N-acetylmuramoyl-pentapeptide-transferase [Zongyangia hominis]MBC8570108.1 phospho-N-acetylmuramoyl-pentapeptide-transferase [Zongyangia hominis]